MILVGAVLVALLTYLAYRRLPYLHHPRHQHHHHHTTPAHHHRNHRKPHSATNSPPRLMWPFISTVLSRSEPAPDKSRVPAKATTPLADTTPADPETTPKAKPIGDSNGIPQISLADEADDDDTPPSFPALNSAQRAGGAASSLPPLRPSYSSMPPPPIPTRNPRFQNPSQWSAPSAGGRNRLAPVGAGASGVAAGNGLSLPNRRGGSSSAPKKSRKVVLEPGHSPLDWARLQKSGMDLRGIPNGRLLKVTPSMLAAHKTAPDDVWMALQGKVYNISAYIPFHPGGEKELLRAAGKDGTKLFNATHPWVNVDGMLEECMVGILVSEGEAKVASELETVD